MAEGYEDIERLTQSQNERLDNALQQQQDITNKQTEMNVAELERNKEQIDKDATKTNRALYTEYRKASNPYGANAEQLASQGLANSGYAESTQANLYNTFQRNVTDTLNNARELKSNFDFEINKARQTGDITLAQNALAIYQQKMQLLTQEYELKNNREQFLYQKEQDKQAQSNWEKEYLYQQERDKVSDQQWLDTFNYNKGRDEISDQQWLDTFKYNKGRDKVSDKQWNKTFEYQKKQDKQAQSNWEKEYQLSKKASASSSRRKSSSGSTSELNIDDGNTQNQNNKTTENTKNKKSVLGKTAQSVLNNVLNTLSSNTLLGKVVQGGSTMLKGAVKGTAKEMVYRAYQDRKINDDEAELIFSKLGL